MQYNYDFCILTIFIYCLVKNSIFEYLGIIYVEMSSELEIYGRKKLYLHISYESTSYQCLDTVQ